MPFEVKRTDLPINREEIDVPSTVIICPHCRVKSHLTPATHSWSREDRVWVLQKCDNCRRLVLTIFKWTGSIIAEPGRGNIPTLNGLPEDVFPYFRLVPDLSIPQEIAEDYSEALLCFSADAFDASVVMSRRAIETAAILLGAKPEDTLRDKIKHLASKGLEQSLVDFATEIRLLGNVPGAHPDKHDLLRKVQPDECKDVLDFLEAFLESLYIRPAKIQKLKSKREKKGTP